MHGRVKVKTSAEQQEEKRKERQSKLKIFRKVINAFFNKVSKEEYDNDGLEITKQILASNSDYSSMWNYRKKCFANSEKPKSEIEAMLNSELTFIESCLRNNPKSYGCWHQRCFVLLKLKTPDWKRELQLCNLFLQFDDRNFHCWDYRRFVCSHSNHPLKDEIDYTNKLIESNFSNYSSWHYRSKLLPEVYPDSSVGNKIAERKLLEELELVQNAFFTDPNDQSAWFYHKWLLGRGHPMQSILSLHVSRFPSTLTCTLRKPIKEEDCQQALVRVNGTVISGKWKPHSSACYMNTWTFTPHEKIGTGLISVSCQVDGVETQITMEIDDNEALCCAKNTIETFCESSSDAKLLVLEEELNSCRELNELEPDNKWVVLTLVFLMKAIDPIRFFSEMKELLKSLCIIDSKRSCYYQDLHSKYAVENWIICADLQSRKADLRNKGITRLCHVEFLVGLTHLDLSHNKLKALGSTFLVFPWLQELKADDNEITEIDGLKALPSLITLSLNSNALSSVELLSCLSTCPNLQHVSLKSNPVSSCEKDYFKNFPFRLTL
ncbi:unnamed protein product [Clavelina lepadiformis]|uniref:Geranylgeranyl transferase type-2 subunit alpha n=1 Tax=Clavelina lepadiformis TaxID=159417 RepID=A0ABP0G2V6_CLALP